MAPAASGLNCQVLSRNHRWNTDVQKQENKESKELMMYYMLSKYKQAILEQILNSKRLFPDQGTKIPRLFPTLFRLWKTRQRRARVAGIGRLKKRIRNRWI